MLCVKASGTAQLTAWLLPACRVLLQVYDPCLARAGAEMMAAAACIGSSTLALGQVG
jgi:hypothetical protein